MRSDLGTGRQPARPNIVLLLLALPAAAAILWPLYTHQIWEDYLITLRHTENLVSGHGLVYQPGERVHGFTSVLNTLVPALPMWLTHSFNFSLNFYRACSLGFLLGGLYYLWRTLAAKLAATGLELAVFAVLMASSVKVIAFTMNGQETGFLLGFLALGIGAVLRADEPRIWRVTAVAWTGLMYTRPDSPLYIAMLAGLELWLGANAGGGDTARSSGRNILRAGATCAIVYTPWFLFAWMYYGSPVPHTITAKAADTFFANDSTLATFHGIWNYYIEVAGDVYGPVWGLEHWPDLLGWGVMLGGGIASFAWMFRGADRLARGVSFMLMLTLLYMAWLRVQRDAFPWYFGPSTLFATIVWCRLAFAQKGRRSAALLTRATLAGVALASIWCFALSLKLQRIQQSAVEDDTRKQIGLWLKDKVAAGESVYLEPIGYIGYYSGAKILDYPGLVAPEVVAARKANKADFVDLPQFLKPQWIVARYEEAGLFARIPAMTASYDIVKEFNNRDALVAQYGPFAGDTSVLHDLRYLILHRKPGM